jgi:signal transduction histidine kinase
MTTTDDVAVTDPAARDQERSRPRERRGPGIRARILVWSVVTLILASVASVFVVRQVLFVQIDGRIDDALAQEANELRRLAGGTDPLTGEPFGADARRIFEVFLDRNVPARNETYLTFVDGEPFRSTFRQPPYALDRDPELAARAADLDEVERGSLQTPAGTVEYLAVPVVDGGRTLGVFVAAFFRDLEALEVGTATWAAIGVGILAVVVGSLVSWRIAEGVLRPVRTTTETARRIAHGDTSRRIPVTGTDEISRLARTFNEMLDSLDEALQTQRRFLDDAGHELRTPITIVRGHLELMDDDPVERQQTLELVEDELDRMQRIVNDLLTLAKAERPDFLTLEPVDLTTLVDEVTRKAEALGPRDWHRGASARGVIVADRQRLTQALVQLADNAVRHTRDGDRIEIATAIDGALARVTVRDHGEGIAPEDLPQIFERFSRGGARRSSEGAGLGLSIVAAIAKAHGGRVEVESERGIGASFTLVVPVEGPSLEEVGDA